GSRDRAYAEGERVARELGLPPDRDVLDALDDASGTPNARVAILFDYEDLWAAEIQPHAAAFTYWRAVLAFYAPLRGLGLDVDLVPKKLAGRPADRGGRDLGRYRLVVAPAMQLADDDLAARLSAYVRAGGSLLLGPRSGTRTTTMLAQPAAPGPLRSLVGARVDRVDGLRPGVHRTLTRAEDGRPLRYGVWADLLEPEEGTRVLASYDDPAYRGAAAYVARRHGDGEARVLGALLEPDAMTALLAPWLGEVGLDPTPLPEGVRRSGDWLLNFMDHEVHAYGAAVPPHGAVRLAPAGEGGGARG
ncbi:MAG: hypothetical protein GVY27_07645, partial [Deinococcus-Thermus bacterium]|nr:hypothetical protein [Deinococcota bacterium]